MFIGIYNTLVRILYPIAIRRYINKRKKIFYLRTGAQQCERLKSDGIREIPDGHLAIGCRGCR